MKFKQLPIKRFTDDGAVFSHRGLWEKYKVCRHLKPKTIVEIGVRAGYSAQAFALASPKAQYIGFDMNSGTYGGVSNTEYTDFAKARLEEMGHKVTIYDDFDTQAAGDLPITGADFFHVDGDHSASGAWHDLELCYPHMNDDAVIMVDDYDMVSVASGATIFCNHHQHLVMDFVGKKVVLIYDKRNTKVPSLDRTGLYHE